MSYVPSKSKMSEFLCRHGGVECGTDVFDCWLLDKFVGFYLPFTGIDMTCLGPHDDY